MKKKLRKTLRAELCTLCPGANEISLLHLGLSIKNKYKFYLTQDMAVLSKAKQLKKKYKIILLASMYDYLDARGK